MYFSILILPLLGFKLATNRKCGNIGGPILSVLCKKQSALYSQLIFYEVGLSGSPVSLNLGNWIDYGNLKIEWEFLFDGLTVTMFLPIVLISFLIQIYSLEYKGHDPHKARFFSLLSLFTFAMLILVTGENQLLIFSGWETVGLVSYLLVNFWFTRKAANKASKSAQFINKVGDKFFIIAIIMAITLLSDLSLSTIFSVISYINGDIIFILTLFIIGAAKAKSALIGLHTWLPKAMEGPTSVSALLHSSTKVTAGVYLLKRISPILEFSSTSLMIITWLGSLGALFGAACGLVDNDIKRIIAYSTCSQLGYMIVAVGVSQYSLALLHLFTHAFFKSLLFLASGAIQHAVKDNQDIRRKGSLNLLLPFTYLVFFFGSFSLKAFPFTAGFYSKDFLLELLITPVNFTHTIAYLFTLFAALLTSIYSIRLFMIALLSRPSFPLSILSFVVDSSFFMNLPLFVLSKGAVFIGYLTQELFLSFGSIFYFNSLFIHPASLRLLDAPFSASILALLPLLFQFLILFIIFISPSNNTLSSNSIQETNIINQIRGINYNPGSSDIHIRPYNVLNNLTFLNHFNIFNHWIKYYFLIFSNYLYRYLDKGLLELLGPLGLVRLLHYIGFSIELLSTGFIPHYAFIIISFVSFFTIFKIIL